MEQKNRKRAKDARGHSGTEEQKEVDKAYVEESLYWKIFRMLNRYSDANIHNPEGRSKLARNIARKLVDTLLDEELPAVCKKPE